jgi:hypothetical protein
MVDAETGELLEIPLGCLVAYNHVPATPREHAPYVEMDPLKVICS